jgi:hypothetical protein
MPPSTNWRKSSFSEDVSGACVEVAFADTGAAVRDSKNTDGPQLRLPSDSWRQFLHAAAR